MGQGNTNADYYVKEIHTDTHNYFGPKFLAPSIYNLHRQKAKAIAGLGTLSVVFVITDEIWHTQGIISKLSFLKIYQTSSNN